MRIADGATVPLFYENRIPELQLINEDFADELDDDASRRPSSTTTPRAQLARRFATRVPRCITRPERLRTIAEDLVAHFVGRGFDGKAMFVGDRQGHGRSHVRPVQERVGRAPRRAARPQHDGLPELERPWLEAASSSWSTTDMAVVVSQAQNEIADLDAPGPRHPPAPQADDRRGPRRRSSRTPTTRSGSCSCARCG